MDEAQQIPEAKITVKPENSACTVKADITLVSLGLSLQAGQSCCAEFAMLQALAAICVRTGRIRAPDSWTTFLVKSCCRRTCGVT